MTGASQLSLGGVDVSRETFDALKAYEALVQRWTPAINLVSKSTVSNLWHRHIVDSAQIFSECPLSAEKWVDLGSGGGFPGIVIAILAKELWPRLHVTLVESDLRKATFLRQAALTLGLQATVLSKRIEALAPLSTDVLSARALAPLSALLGYAATHLARSGTAIFPKGARYQEEIADARKAWSFDIDIKPSLSEAEAAILVIRNIQSAQH